MAWIESHQELGRHPKTKRLARMLGISVVQAVGHLHFLWWWAIDYADDGNLEGLDASDIADAGQWEGDADAFLMALITTRFVDGADNETLQLHDWWEYAGRLVERRKDNAERMREKRATHVQRTCNARTGATVPTVPNQPTEQYSAAANAADSPEPPKRPAGPRKGENLPAMFEEFWAAYPRKKARAEAITAYKKALKNGTTPENLCAGSTHYAEECRLVTRDDQYVLLPSTFLNKRRFEDHQQPPDPKDFAPKFTPRPLNGRNKPIEEGPEYETFRGSNRRAEPPE